MLLSFSILGAVAWATLAAGVALMVFPEPGPAQILSVEDRRSTAPYRHRVVDPNFAELVYAALLSRAAGRRVLVVTTREKLIAAARDALLCAKAPVAALEVACPGVRWVPSQRAGASLVVSGVEPEPFVIPPERRKFVGSLLSRLPELRARALAALREDRSHRLPHLWGAARGPASEKLLPPWARMALHARDGAFEAEATDLQVVEAITHAIRAGGGDVMFRTGPVSAKTTPSMALPRRGSVVEGAPLNAGRAIVAAPDRPEVCALLTRHSYDRDPTLRLYLSDEHPATASRALAAATGSRARAASCVRLADAVEAAARAAWGARWIGAALRGTPVSKAFG